MSELFLKLSRFVMESLRTCKEIENLFEIGIYRLKMQKSELLQKKLLWPEICREENKMIENEV